MTTSLCRWLIRRLGRGPDFVTPYDPCLHCERVRRREEDSDAAGDQAQGADEARGDQHKAGDQSIGEIRAGVPQHGRDAESRTDPTPVGGEDDGRHDEVEREAPKGGDAEGEQAEGYGE